MSLEPAFVLLTTGDRSEELDAAIASIRAQTVTGQIVLVCNGCKTDGLGDDVLVIELDDNVGIPAGRNVGLAACDADVVFFLDDDGFYATPTAAADALAAFASDPELGIVSFRIVDPEGSPGQRRHVPRLRAGDPERSSPVTTFLGGACAIRSTVFSTAGLFPANFFYAHEETDLAWRAIDAGWTVLYRADVAIVHPTNAPPGSGRSVFLSSRNRVFLARRRLPILLAGVYVALWALISLLRSPGKVDVLSGVVAGLSEDSGERAQMSWRTVLVLTRLGRPPII